MTDDRLATPEGMETLAYVATVIATVLVCGGAAYWLFYNVWPLLALVMT